MRKLSSASSVLHFVLFFLLFHLFFSFCSASAFQRNYLGKGASSSVKADAEISTILSSPDSSFSFGFYRTGTNAYALSIWYANSRERTVVWMANRDRPVNGHGSKVSMAKTGAMVLTDVDGAVVWQTNTTSADVARAELLATGNLVLRNSKNGVVWQSFDYPTDTLLPSQFLTKSTRLVSSIRTGSYGSGYYNLYFDSSNVFRLVYDGPEISSIYWPNPDFDLYRNGRTAQNSSRIAVLDDKGIFRSSDFFSFNVSDMGSAGTMRRMTLGHDGNLRVYSLINSTGLWETSWQALSQPCRVHGLCGRNAICEYTPRAKCSCPPGYKVSDPTDWNKGCETTFNRSLLSTNKDVKFVEIPKADFYGFDLNISQSITFESCKNKCLSDANCLAFTYKITGYGLCYVKSALFNGYKRPDFEGALYLKVPQNLLIPSSPVILQGSDPVCSSEGKEIVLGPLSIQERTGGGVKWVYFFSFVSAIGAIELVVFVLGWFFFFRKSGIPASVEAGYEMIASQFRRFSYLELKKATENFKNEVGRGGSGAVYKGLLPDGREVAVKILGDVLAEEEFWAEMSTIGKINHMNLVRMWGYCSDKRRRLLVYEFVENSSLDKHLFRLNSLGWKQRFAVAVGMAKGLAYLHHECLEWVIHCDVKPENILLDGDFQPKIADFGLAKLYQREAAGAGPLLSRIRGTKGYMAPEWALNQPITAKVDVYSYGVVVLEMVRGIRLSSWAVMADGDTEPEMELTKMARTVWECGEELWTVDLVDPRLEGEFSRKQAAALIRVGMSCVEEDRNKRPTMATVVQTLIESESEDDEAPTAGASLFIS